MSLVSILFTQLRREGTQVSSETNAILLDVTISEQPEFRSRVTANPVEDGTLINDHVIDDPDVVTFTGIISDTPIRFLSGLRDLFESGYGSASRSQAAFELLKSMRDEKKILTIVSGLTIYKDMVITSFAPTRSVSTGKSLQFTITLQKIRKVTSQTIKIAASKIKAEQKSQIQSITDAGKQAAATADTTTEGQGSFLYSILQSVGVVK